MNELKILSFIKNNSNWEEILTKKPYSLNVSRENGFMLLKYNQIESDPKNEIVKEARGIIFHEEAHAPVCVPFFRFYNVQEDYADKIDWESAIIQEKIDGPILKVWSYNSEWYLSTNGTINAFTCDLQSKIASSVSTFGELFLKAVALESLEDFAEKYSLDKNYTYLFEIVSPYNRVVVPYSETQIFHIGTRNNVTLQEENIDLGIQKPKTYNFSSLNDCINMAKELPFSEEGYVVVDKFWKRNKIKSPAYIAAHHLKNNGVISNYNIVELLMNGESVEFLAIYPEYKNDFDRVQEELNLLEMNLHAIDVCILSKKNLGRKEFAEVATKTKYPDFAFQLYDSKISTSKEYIDLYIEKKGYRIFTERLLGI